MRRSARKNHQRIWIALSAAMLVIVVTAFSIRQTVPLHVPAQQLSGPTKAQN